MLGKHVVFGRVIRGYDVVEKIAALPVDNKDRPLAPIVISNCGELELRKPPGSCSRRCCTRPVNFTFTLQLKQNRNENPAPVGAIALAPLPR